MHALRLERCSVHLQCCVQYKVELRALPLLIESSHCKASSVRHKCRAFTLSLPFKTEDGIAGSQPPGRGQSLQNRRGCPAPRPQRRCRRQDHPVFHIIHHAVRSFLTLPLHLALSFPSLSLFLSFSLLPSVSSSVIFVLTLFPS